MGRRRHAGLQDTRSLKRQNEPDVKLCPIHGRCRGVRGAGDHPVGRGCLHPAHCGGWPGIANSSTRSQPGGERWASRSPGRRPAARCRSGIRAVLVARSGVQRPTMAAVRLQPDQILNVSSVSGANSSSGRSSRPDSPCPWWYRTKVSSTCQLAGNPCYHQAEQTLQQPQEEHQQQSDPKGFVGRQRLRQH